MTEIWLALALILVIEGALYALFPDGMKRMIGELLTVPTGVLRRFGLGAAAVGVLLVGLIRG